MRWEVSTPWLKNAPAYHILIGWSQADVKPANLNLGKNSRLRKNSAQANFPAKVGCFACREQSTMGGA
jgi:hypothetical protein